MNLYLENGYVDIRKILKIDVPFIFCIGGRGTGKTFGALSVVYEDKIPFMLLRRTQTQADMINLPEFSPFKSVNRVLGANVVTDKVSKYNSAFISEDQTIGYSAALTTIANIRGFDASQCDLLVFDEFIPESHERKIKDEGTAFLNAYETINRNRELEGRKPLKCLALSNSNTIANPIFITLKLVEPVRKMIQKGKNIYIDQNRGVAVVLLSGSPISNEKNNTALYKLSKDTRFREMSLSNDFGDDTSRLVKAIPIQEVKPVVKVGELTIYRHKSKKFYYVSSFNQGSAEEFYSDNTSLKRFFRAYSWIWSEYLKENVYFDSLYSELLLTNYINSV